MIDSETIPDLPGATADVRPEEKIPPATGSASGRRPRRSKKISPASEEDASAGEQATESAKTGRSSRARGRKAEAAASVSDPEIPEDASATPVSGEKPKRQRRTRRTGTKVASSPAAEESSGETVPETTAQVSSDSVHASGSAPLSEQSVGPVGMAGTEAAVSSNEKAAPEPEKERADIPSIAMAVMDIPAIAAPVTPAVAIPAAVPAVSETVSGAGTVEAPVSAEKTDTSPAQEGNSSKRRRARRSRRRPSLSPEELAALAVDSPVPDYVSDDDDDEEEVFSEAPSEVSAGTAGVEAPSSEKRSRRSRRGRRRSGPETVIEKQDSEPEALGEEQTFMLPTDVLEELMADVLENAPAAQGVPSGDAEAKDAGEEGEPE